MRLFLDDIREPWRFGFITSEWAHTAEEAIEMLKTGEVTFATLDHDLAPEHYVSTSYLAGTSGSSCGQGCGCVVVDWMEENNIWPIDGVVVHSQNPAGAARMRQAIDKHYGEGWSRQWALHSLEEFVNNLHAGKYKTNP